MWPHCTILLISYLSASSSALAFPGRKAGSHHFTWATDPRHGCCFYFSSSLMRLPSTNYNFAIRLRLTRTCYRAKSGDAKKRHFIYIDTIQYDERNRRLIVNGIPHVSSPPAVPHLIFFSMADPARWTKGRKGGDGLGVHGGSGFPFHHCCESTRERHDSSAGGKMEARLPNVYNRPAVTTPPPPSTSLWPPLLLLLLLCL